MKNLSKTKAELFHPAASSFSQPGGILLLTPAGSQLLFSLTARAVSFQPGVVLAASPQPLQTLELQSCELWDPPPSRARRIQQLLKLFPRPEWLLLGEGRGWMSSSLVACSPPSLQVRVPHSWDLVFSRIWGFQGDLVAQGESRKGKTL